MVKRVDLLKDIPTVAIRPTKSDPDVQVVIGSDNGKYVPKQLLYPDHYTDNDIQSKVQKYQADGDSGCKVCNRYATEKKMLGGLIAISVVSVVAVTIVLSLKDKKK